MKFFRQIIVFINGASVASEALFLHSFVFSIFILLFTGGSDWFKTVYGVTDHACGYRHQYSFFPSKFRPTGSRSFILILTEESFVYLRIHNLHDSTTYDQLSGTQVAFLGNKKKSHQVLYFKYINKRRRTRRTVETRNLYLNPVHIDSLLK